MTDALDFADQRIAPGERRQHLRQQVRSIAYVELDEGNGGIVLNVSEGGLSVQAVVSLMDDQLPRMRIQLPQPNDWVEAGARIAWTGKSRKVVGLEFVDLPEQARNQIREWISQETLPAPSPRESKTEPHEDEGAGVTAPASEAASQVVEPVAAGPFPEDPAENVSLTNDGPILAAVQAEETTPTKDSGVVPAPAPTPEGRPPAPPSLNLGATPRPTAPPAGQVVAGAFDQPRFAELKLTGRSTGAVSQPPREVPGYKTLAMLITMLALVSLAAGWAAGRGAFDVLFAKVHAMTSHKSAATQDVKTPPTTPMAPVSQIQATKLSKLDPAIPVGAPTPTPKPISRGKTVAKQAQETLSEPMALQASNSVPTVHRPGYARSLDEAPLPVTDLGGPANVLPAAGSMDFRLSVPPPQVKRQPAVLKPAELIHRVEPVYPMMAREERIEGTVKLRVTIGQDGAVHNVELLSGSPLLSGAAISAVSQWRYSPTTLNGKPIQADNEVNLVFRLSASSP